MKKRIAILIVVLMVLSLSACGSKKETAEPTENAEAAEEGEAAEEAEQAEQAEESEEDSSKTDVLEDGSSGITASAAPKEVSINNASYVMIFDPYIFDELNEKTRDVTSLFSGNLGSQIIVGMHKAGNLETENAWGGTISQDILNSGLDANSFDRSGHKAGGMDPVYKKGDSKDFYGFDKTMEKRVLQSFKCVYEGEHCYVWMLKDGTDDVATLEGMGKEFDEKIYPADVQAFGKARFTESGGKVNILVYPIGQETGILGFFCIYDIFGTGEATAQQVTDLGLNLDHAIININSDFITTKSLRSTYATLGHEFQHLICASNVFNFSATPFMRTWLNEAMSAYAEDLIYPGIKVEEQYNYLYYLSERFQKGQSLYNFDTTDDDYIGAYGAVYLYANYLSEKGGKDVFSKVHDFWRNSYRADIDEAEAVVKAVPEAYVKEIQSKYSFGNLTFNNPNEELLSKMTLDFYIETLQGKLASVSDPAILDQLRLLSLYSEINPLDVEGGGRVIVATQNGKFQAPIDSERGLVYVGLDENFNVTEIVPSN